MRDVFRILLALEGGKLVEELITRAAVEQGIWAILFVSLFFYQLKESKRREERLMAFIDDIAQQFKILDSRTNKISCDLDDIKHQLKGRRTSNG